VNVFRVPTTAIGYPRAYWQRTRGTVRPDPPGVIDKRITPEFGDLEQYDIRTDTILTAVCLGPWRLLLSRDAGSRDETS
jgi:hypothetical protein